MLDWRDAWGPSEPRAGHLKICFWKFEAFMEMPDTKGSLFQRPSIIERFGHWPWCFLVVPVLLIALAFKVTYTAAFGSYNWRLRRLYHRLLRKYRPEKAMALVAARDAEATATKEHIRELMAQAEARRAAKEAAYEAEIERRVAERMAALGVA